MAAFIATGRSSGIASYSRHSMCLYIQDNMDIIQNFWQHLLTLLHFLTSSQWIRETAITSFQED